MSKAYFEVGEEVILCSKYYPQYDGDFTVIDIITKDEVMEKLNSRGLGFDTYSSHYWYNLGFSFLLDFGNNDYFDYCGQSSLKKKHEGGRDFKKMIASLNNTKYIPA